MKEINLKERSEKAINALNDAIKAAEGRATVRKISAENICDALDRVSGNLGISKKAMDGIKVHGDLWAQDFPRAYKYVPESTHFKATYKNGSWRVTDVYRDTCGRKRMRVELTDAAEEAILAQYETMD